tara:strand:- start:693 stop:914 length:222 start_codon:yes stop_codon:yes gene_type:complete
LSHSTAQPNKPNQYNEHLVIERVKIAEVFSLKKTFKWVLDVVVDAPMMKYKQPERSAAYKKSDYQIATRVHDN